MVATEIRDAALALPEDEREQLVLDLWDSLSQDDGVAKAWATEIERRAEAVDRGDVRLVDSEEARTAILARLELLRR